MTKANSVVKKSADAERRRTSPLLQGSASKRAASLAAPSLLPSVRLRLTPEHCPQDGDEEQGRNGPMEPDPVRAGEDVDQNKEARNRKGHGKGARQAREPVRDE